MMHLPDLPPGSPCLGMAASRRYWDRWRWQRVYGPCGLLWQHPGPCVLFAPGDYLPPPLLHPLDTLFAPPFTWRCPLCGDAVKSVNEDYVTAFRGRRADWDWALPETQLTFWPCGCVGREIIPCRREAIRPAPPTPPA